MGSSGAPVSDNLREFNLELGEIAESMPAELVLTAHRRIHMSALDRIVRRTPVDTGRARGNWQSTEGQPSTAQIATVRSSEEVHNEGLSVTSRLAPYSASYIANSLDYIEVLEDGGFIPKDPGPSRDPRPDREGRVLVRGGYSVQAPQGMVALTFAELENSIGGDRA